MRTVTVYKSIDVEVEIDLDDVTDFISEASKSDLEEIAKALAGKDVYSTLTAFDAATIRHLIERANIFGIEDMMNDLKREGERVGAYLRVEVKV